MNPVHPFPQLWGYQEQESGGSDGCAGRDHVKHGVVHGVVIAGKKSPDKSRGRA